MASSGSSNTEELQEEITCAALRTLGNAGGLEVGKVYVVTDYNRGTLGPCTILTHAVTVNEVSWNVSVQTQFDDSAWMGRWDPDTCRIIDLFDNRGNKIRSDNGDEIETFPWGNSSVSGNTFTDFDFNYTSGIVRDNTGDPTARLDVNGGTVEQSVFASLAVATVADTARLIRSAVVTRGRIVLSGTALVESSTVADYSYMNSDALVVAYTNLTSTSYLYGLGAAGRVDNSNLDRGYVDIRNVPDVNIDDLDADSYGRLLAINAARVRILRTSISSSAYIQVSADREITATECALDSTALMRALNGELIADNVKVSSAGRVDQNTPGSNRVTSCTAKNSGIIEFINTATGNLIDASEARNSGALRFRGTSAAGRIHRTTADSGYVQIQDSNNVRSYYNTVNAIGYMIIRGGSDGFFIYYSECTGYGRLLVEQASAGRILGTTLNSTAYVRLRAHASDLRYSHFDSYFYYYLTGNAAPKSGLNGSGRQSYTEPNPGAGVTGPGVRNW